MKVRLKDIAEYTNLSVATISIIINNPETTRFPEVTKQRVLKAAKELNYVPNITARSLVKNKTYVIGLLIPDLENPFFSSLAKTIEIHLRQKGYTTLIVNSNENYLNDIKLIRSLIGRNVDGMLLALSNNSYEKSNLLIKELNDVHQPFVLMDRTLDSFKCNQVLFDNEMGQYLATKHVLENGHRNVGYIAGNKKSANGSKRLEGFHKALRKFGIKENEDLILYGDFIFNSGYANTQYLVDQGVTAIVCANDLIAFGVVKKINELGLKVPNDLSIVGYDNLKFNDMLDIGLTSINQNIQELALESINLLLFQLSNNNTSCNKEIIISTNLVERKSVKEVVIRD